LEIAGNIIMVVGVVFMFFGVIGLFKFKDFYLKILVLAKIDTVGALTFMFGVIIKHGFSFFSLKVLLIMILFLILNPLTAHIIARAAYLSIEGKSVGSYADDAANAECRMQNAELRGDGAADAANAECRMQNGAADAANAECRMQNGAADAANAECRITRDV